MTHVTELNPEEGAQAEDGAVTALATDMEALALDGEDAEAEELTRRAREAAQDAELERAVAWSTEPFPGESAELRALFDEAFPIKYGDSFYDAVQSREFNGRELLAVSARARDTNELMGAATACVQEPGSQPDVVRGPWLVAYILTLAVRPDSRRRGVARALVRRVRQWAAAHLGGSSQRCGALYLHVIHYNESAITLYERTGFTRVRREIDFYPINGESFDAFLYATWLNDAEPAPPPAPSSDERAPAASGAAFVAAAPLRAVSSLVGAVWRSLSHVWALLFEDEDEDEGDASPADVGRGDVEAQQVLGSALSSPS